MILHTFPKMLHSLFVSSVSGGGGGGGGGGGLRRTASVPDHRASTGERRPDPVREVCDLQVKIADLGNACWVVRVAFFMILFLFIST